MADRWEHPNLGTEEIFVSGGGDSLALLLIVVVVLAAVLAR